MGCAQFRLDYALSREQNNARGGKMYIQDKVEEYSDEVFDLLDNGAHIYFCGLKGMMPGAALPLCSIICFLSLSSIIIDTDAWCGTPRSYIHMVPFVLHDAWCGASSCSFAPTSLFDRALQKELLARGTINAHFGVEVQSVFG